MKRCPKCGGEKFDVTYHVTQTVQVDGEGNFIKELTSCDEVTHRADDEDIWTCAQCGYSDPGFVFNVQAEEKSVGEKLLEECKNAKDYTAVAIYDQGEIVATRSVSEIFLDCVETFALIRKLPEKPAGELSIGLTVYNTKDTDYDLGRITELSTWQALVKNHFTDAFKDPKETALFFALSSAYPIPDEVFDLLYAAYPGTPLEGILYDCKRLDAVKWAVAHGADRFYDGYKHPMQETLSWTRRGPEAEAIYWYLYNEDPADYKRKE